MPRPSGRTRTQAEREAKGLTRLPSVYLSPEAEAGRAILAARLGSTKAAIEWALTMAPMPPRAKAG